MLKFGSIPAWALILVGAIVVVCVQQIRVLSAQSELTDYRLEIAERDKRAGAFARSEEQRRQSISDKEAKDAHNQQSIAESNAAAASADADSLRKQVARLLASRAANCDAIAANGSKAAGSIAGVLAELLDESVRRNQVLAREADASRIAGQACERIYNGVRNEPKP